eukprot:SAG22_NODE_8967_length_618_cov_0.784200_1_plen_47_part_10
MGAVKAATKPARVVIYSPGWLSPDGGSLEPLVLPTDYDPTALDVCPT